MADERDAKIDELERQLKWAREDNERLARWLDEALIQLREANNRDLAAAKARTAEVEARLARATLDARAPDVKLH
jgi:hypothetical protein